MIHKFDVGNWSLESLRYSDWRNVKISSILSIIEKHLIRKILISNCSKANILNRKLEGTNCKLRNYIIYPNYLCISEASYLFSKRDYLALTENCEIVDVLCVETDRSGSRFRGKLCLQIAIRKHSSRLVIFPGYVCIVLLQKVIGLLHIILGKAQTVGNVTTSEVFAKRNIELAWVIEVKILRKFLTSFTQVIRILLFRCNNKLKSIAAF